MSNPNDYTVGWICAIATEYVAAQEFLDEEHQGPEFVSPHDNNHYTLGRVGRHNVVIAVLPDSEYGKSSATSVARDMMHTFPNIRFGLMVGIAGGAPGKHDIRLGDIVISCAGNGKGGVLGYDFGKAIQGQGFQETGFLNQPPQLLRATVSGLKARYERKGHQLSEAIEKVLEENKRLRKKYKRPDPGTDNLFRSEVTHDLDCGAICSNDASKFVSRPERSEDEDNPAIHYGLVASADRLMKDALARDRLSEEKGVLCFEMEAAGLMNHFPYLVIRGICDYSDSHKNKEWQGYAAMVAAAYARDILYEISPNRIEAESKISDILSGFQEITQEHRDVSKEHRDIAEKQLQVQRDLAKERLSEECMRDLYITNPQDDKESIVMAKGGLLTESYIWVMENESYQQWINDDESRLLWIKGDPGKGKTMLLCGIINKLETNSPHSVFYFFCQAAEPRLRSASAVLRGLIWFLARTRPNLISHIRKEYHQAGKDVFNDHNALQALSSIMAAMLEDETTSDCVFIIDALDECVDDRERLIALVSQFSSFSRSKWIVSSRNWPEIEAQLEGVTNVRLHLELNHASIADAVQKFISRKVGDLAKTKRYTKSTRDTVLHHLLTNANDTFLWVSLVSEELGKYNALPHHTQSILESFPAGLEELYQRMTNQLLHCRDGDICKAILAVVTVAFRPLSLAELAASDEKLTCFHSDLETLSSIIKCCGSFLTIRNNIVYTVHQSVKDYLVNSSDIFPSGITGHHYSIFLSIMDRMQVALHRNLYSAHDNALYIDEISKPLSSSMDSIRYGCIYWVDHLHKSTAQALEWASTCILVERFLKTKYLYWLEAMSLLRCAPIAVRALRKLRSGLPGTASKELEEFSQDALRFALAHRVICDTVPLQLYDSALIFSPSRSKVRQTFIGEISANIEIFPSSFDQWDALLFNIPNIADDRSDLGASPSGERLAVTHRDGTSILILDSFTGEIVKQIESDQRVHSILGFNAEGKYLATASGYPPQNKVMIWDTYTGKPIRTIENVSHNVFLSHDRMHLFLAESSGYVQVWDPWDGSGKYTLDLRYRDGRIEWIDFCITKSGTPCLLSIISRKSSDNFTKHYKVVVHNPQTGDVVANAPLDAGWGDCETALDPDCKRLLLGSIGGGLRLWDGEMLVDLRNDFPTCLRLAWAPDGRSFAVVTNDAVILCDPTTQARIARILLPVFGNSCLCYLNGTTLAFLDQGSLRMLDVGSTSSETTSVNELPFQINPGPNGQLELCRFGEDNEILVAAMDNTLHRLHIPGSHASHWRAVFSPDHEYAFVDAFGWINIWNINSCLCLHKLRGHANDTGSSQIAIVFDLSGQLVSANHEDGTIRIWNPVTGDCLYTIESRRWSHGVRMAASADGRIAIAPEGKKALYTWQSGHVGGGRTKWTMARDGICLSFNSRGLLALLWESSKGEDCVSILDVRLGTCLGTYCMQWSLNPYVRFDPSSNFRIDVGSGVIDLDLQSLIGAEEWTEKRRFKVHTGNSQPAVWNQQFLAFRETATGAWLMRGLKKVLWVPEVDPESVRVISDFSTGASVATMSYNSYIMLIRIRAS